MTRCAHQGCDKESRFGLKFCWVCWSNIKDAKPCRHPIRSVEDIVDAKLEKQLRYGDDRAQEIIEEGGL